MYLRKIVIVNGKKRGCKWTVININGLLFSLDFLNLAAIFKHLKYPLKPCRGGRATN